MTVLPLLAIVNFPRVLSALEAPFLVSWELSFSHAQYNERLGRGQRGFTVTLTGHFFLISIKNSITITLQEG